MSRLSRVAFLSVSFYPYRVPVFDLLYKQLGERFVVIAINHQRKEGYSGLALKMGLFPRRILSGVYIEISRKHDQGQETPFGVVVAPAFPLELFRLRPQVVISANFNLWTLISLLMRYNTIVFFEGTAHTERTLKPWRTQLRKWMVDRAKAFVVNGKLSNEYLQQLGAKPDRIFEGGLCPLPAPVTRTPYQANQPVHFLFVGRLVDGKGVPTLLEAIRLLLDQNRPFRVSLLGNGPQRATYEAQVQALGIGHVVHFLGTVMPEVIWPVYQNADVFVLPTRQDNWPLVVPEAMSVGLPILLSNVAGSVPDLIEEGGNGWSFEPYNANQLAAYMGAYLENPKLIDQHGKRSLELVKTYTPERVSQVFLQAISLAAY